MSNNRRALSKFRLGLGMVVASLLTACAIAAPEPHDARVPIDDFEPFLAPREGATLEKPKGVYPRKNVCGDPANYPPRAFDLPQLSSAELLGLFDSPSTVSELLSNIKLLAERDLLVQSALFDDDVLLKLFGAAEITWEKSEQPSVYSVPYPQGAMGPMRVGHVKAVLGPMANVTVRVVSNRTCMGWRRTQFPPRAWWPPVTYDSGYMQIDVSALGGLDVGVVKKVFGPDPAEAPYTFIGEFGGGVSYPGNLTYESLEKERRSAPFSHHSVEIIPQQTGNERPGRPGGRRVFGDDTKVLRINISQVEREL